MTDEAGNTHPDPDDDAVRRLLADARHTEPMPADVAARMDDLLDDLAQGTPVGTDAPVPTPTPAPIHPVVASLAAQRRRRAAGMLVAAAAIVVGGVVVAQHLPAPGGSSSASSAENRAGSSVGDTAGGTASKPVRPEANPGILAGGRVTVQDGRVVVRPEHFTSDAVAARRLLERARSTASSYQLLDQPDPACVVPRAHGTRVKATYERAPAVLVFHRPVSSTQVVDLFVCGARRPVRSATLPLP